MPDRGPRRRPAGAVRAGWLLLGWILVGLGIVGALLPLMPTTIFLILAAGCFARSSPRLEAGLLDHPRFGPALRAWRTERAIPTRGKIGACAGMALGLLFFEMGAHPSFAVTSAVAVLLLGCALWIVTRPAPGRCP
ncbi:YbaN family protein [Sphingomonas colocasiae]|uniref:YbaN family protein n=1 Tax=Sphingomonas colocasiae TaxID=1848973 RepID=UPI001FE71EB8|nr:YbaN family protein [Sphingomonas colocasiae]